MAKNNHTTAKIITITAGAAALAATSYYFFGPMGKVHRKKALGWMIKMKGEVIEKLEEAGEMSEEVYHKIIDSVLASNIVAGKVSKPELEAFAKTLKSQWKHISKALTKKTGKKVTKKAVKAVKTAKKVQ
jgi:hypothetical protein